VKKFDKGVKFDEGKERFDLLPPDALFEITKVFTYGQQKYGERNWEKGMLWGRLFAATMRHLWNWWRGEKYDKESGLSHLAHAGANIFFLLHYEQSYTKYKKYDDRYLKESNERED